MIEFAIVGAGWRTEFYLRIVRAMPERFRVAGVVVRNAEKRPAFAARWGVPVFPDVNELLSRTSPAFVVTSVSWASNPVVLRELVARGVPALSETPPAPDLQGLRDLCALAQQGARIQVAEQYWLQPFHAACLTVIRKGLLGIPTQAQVSIAHGYHGISLIRRFLKLGLELPVISARRFISPLMAGPGRDGPPAEERVQDSLQDFVWFDYGDRLGLLDFTGDQYFSWVRGPRLLIRGERGEIANERLSYLDDFRTPLHLSFQRQAAGENTNLEGLFLKGIQCGDEWVYGNPTAPARLADDEIAIATCLLKMAEYVETGREFYPLAEAAQDHYLNLLCDQALREGKSIVAEPQPWME